MVNMFSAPAGVSNHDISNYHLSHDVHSTQYHTWSNRQNDPCTRSMTREESAENGKEFAIAANCYQRQDTWLPEQVFWELSQNLLQ